MSSVRIQDLMDCKVPAYGRNSNYYQLPRSNDPEPLPMPENKLQPPLIVKETKSKATMTETIPVTPKKRKTEFTQVSPEVAQHKRPTIQPQRPPLLHPHLSSNNQQHKVESIPAPSYNPTAKQYQEARQANQQDDQQEMGQKVPSISKDFVSARTILEADQAKNGRKVGYSGSIPSGLKRPAQRPNTMSKPNNNNTVSTTRKEEEVTDERLKNIDKAMIETITNEIQTNVSNVTWNDIAGLAHAKKSIQEVVVWPMLRPDLFHGIRAPPKGLLLFGPPGTGKTLIGKCIASQVNATFFSISSSSLTSKWIGDGEKMVRALFAVARVNQPSVIFVDEIDSLLTQRTDGEHEATRRMKTEFLVQFDGCGTNAEDRILLIGATNRPGEIDEAARRRFRKKLYIPLPEDDARQKIVENLISTQSHNISSEELMDIVIKTRGYSGSDMDGLVREASLGPLREIHDIASIAADAVRPIMYKDFVDALRQIRASVTEQDLQFYIKFDKEFGSTS